MKRYAYTVTGIVQGVGFRYFTRNTADRLHLTGWVRNAEDGSVEGEVQGDDAVCRSFFERLRSGPSYALIEDVVTSECPSLQNERGFSIAGY
ncbi:MAG: acylphosphatase [Chitinispirillaceae bacterium]|nr:acylphosphatase [Chitinispirillaceae bacterium]